MTADDENLDGDDGDNGGGDGGVKQSNRKRGKGKNILHCVAVIMGSRQNKALYDAIANLTLPVEQEHGEVQIAQKTQWATLQWYEDMAVGARADYISKVLTLSFGRHKQQSSS